MATAKTYLNVPYAEKDAAKALGARWDPANKKWYVPAGKDITLFAQWAIDSALQRSPATASIQRSSTLNGSAIPTSSGVFTYPTTPDFIAYVGDDPPWD